MTGLSTGSSMTRGLSGASKLQEGACKRGRVSSLKTPAGRSGGTSPLRGSEPAPSPVEPLPHYYRTFANALWPDYADSYKTITQIGSDENICEIGVGNRRHHRLNPFCKTPVIGHVPP